MLRCPLHVPTSGVAVIKIIAHDGLCQLLSPTCEHLDEFKLRVRKAAARIFSPEDDTELALDEVSIYLSPFAVPVSGQSDYDIVIEVEVPWSKDLDISLRERSTRLRTAVRELAKQLGYEVKVAAWGRIVRDEWITDAEPDFVPSGQLGFW